MQMYFWYRTVACREDGRVRLVKRRIVRAPSGAEATTLLIDAELKLPDGYYMAGLLMGPYFSRREAETADVSLPVPILLVPSVPIA